jgi:O-acetyl-ADP-ribose deacetylase (regulator of RNase III)
MIANLLVTNERIEKLKVDAICNSAARNLKGGGGVDGAIHKAAGPRLLKSCLELVYCDYGQAKITLGYRLPSQFVIHTAVPKWTGGRQNEELLLEECYANSLGLADYYGVSSVAFSALGGGVRGFPAKLAAYTAVQAIRFNLKKCRYIRQVIFSAPDDNIRNLIENVIINYGAEIETSENWCDDWEEINCTSLNYWFNIVEMSNVHWARIRKNMKGYDILIYNNHGSVFDSISTKTKIEAIHFLERNQFNRWGPGLADTVEIPLPDSRMHHGEKHNIYSLQG